METLYLDSHTHIITDDNDKVVPLEKAKMLWHDNQVIDCSQSFQRLANLDFNFDKLDDFYRENI